ncbi:MAG: PDZ domain-containing protein [Oscillospiraceae bacterium]|nr:PDZ domain-containing protein [Oscillospiraceae bacterium]
MSKRISISFAVSAAALASAVTFILTLSFTQSRFNEKVKEVDRLSEKYQRLDELDRIIGENYYTDVPEDAVTDYMLAGYVCGLGDKYSAYRSSSDMTTFDNGNTGIYTGIGITISRNAAGEAEIIAVTENGPSEKAGLKVGDVIVEVEGISVADHYTEAMSKISGEIGTTVSVRVRVKGTAAVTSCEVMRTQIEEVTVYSEMLEHHIGYIQITGFRTVTVTQFSNALHDVLTAGAEGIIFDLRDNGGGLLSALEKMTDPILPEGELAFSYNKAGEAETIVKSDAEKLDLPLVVLVNGNTASAAELFACLLRDYAGAKLVGEKTFGKGIMQTTFSLSSGGVTLTTATYSTGKTPCYHEIGLEPDVLSVPEEGGETDTQRKAAEETIRAMVNS